MALFGSGRGTYDIQILRENRWVTQSVRNWEKDALEEAERILTNRKVPGVRVVLEDAGGNEDGDEVIFEKRQEVLDKKKANITPIDTAPSVCKQTRDYFSLESRSVMNIIFRNYLETVMLTPSEVLHNPRELRRLQDYESILMSAADVVAKLQIKITGQSLKERRQELVDASDQIVARADRVAGMDLPRLDGSFAKLLERVKGMGGESPEYLAMYVLCDELSKKRSWVDKLTYLVSLAEMEDSGSKSLLFIDTVIADVFGANVMQELLGWQPSLGSAIIAMLDLAEGKLELPEKEQTEIVLKLCEQFASNRLPASREIVIDRAVRQLRSPQPLYRADPSKEMEEYQKVLARFLVQGEILSGAKAAEAITLRGARFIEAGGALGQRSAIAATAKAMPDPARGVMYLSDLSSTEFASDHINVIVQEIDTVFGARVIRELCSHANSPKDLMMTATGAFHSAARSALPNEVKSKVTEHIDTVLERYLADENIVEKLDNPNAHLRDRAVRLVKFCGAGVLPEGKALQMARQRITELLRQPNFDRKFIEGLNDPKVAEAALRSFFKLLQKAGLS